MRVDQAHTPRLPVSRATPSIYWPRDIQCKYNVCAETRWRWEKIGRLPPRDCYLNGKPVGWKRDTIDAAMDGRAVQKC